MRIAYAGTAFAFLAAIAIAATSSIIPRSSASGAIYAILAALLFVSPVAILSRIFTYKRVTGRTRAAALSAYLMIGLFFAFLYLAINSLSSAAFLDQGHISQPAIFVYMSFITMTTVGYGDYTPGTDLGRSLVVLQALIGQIYVVTAISRLVTLYAGPSDEIRARLQDRAREIGEQADS